MMNGEWPKWWNFDNSWTNKDASSEIFARQVLLLESFAADNRVDDSNSRTYLIFPVVVTNENDYQESESNRKEDSDASIWKNLSNWQQL